MTMKRLLKYLAWGLVILIFTGYFAFTTVFFNPFEGSYGEHLSSLVPRDVDYYVAKAELREVFDEFPRLRIADGLEATPGGQVLLNEDLQWGDEPLFANGVYGELESLGFEEAMAQLDASLARSPLPVRVPSLFGGREIALAGYFRGEDPANWDWCAYGRTNWMGKLSVGVIERDLFGALSNQGLQATVEDDVFTLSGGQLEKPLHLTRIFDVLVASNSPELARQARTLYENVGQDSMWQKAFYQDNVQNHVNFERRDVETMFDLRAYLEETGNSGAYPVFDPRESWVQSTLAQLFQVNLLNELVGAIGFDTGVRVDLHATLSSEMLSSLQKSTYRLNAMDRDTVREWAQYAPQDCAFFVTGVADVGDMLRVYRDSIEPDLRNSIDDVARTIWGYPDAVPLIDDLDRALGNRFAFFVRENDYVDNSADPPAVNIPATVFAWTIVFELDDPQKMEAIRGKVVSGQRHLGIQGREPGSPGVFRNQVEGGLIVYEYHQPFIAGTGHLASLTKADVFLMGNSHLMLGHSNQCANGNPDYPRLADLPLFQVMLQNEGLVNSNFAIWANGAPSADYMRQMTAERARDEIFLDWSIGRPFCEQQVLNDHYPEYGTVDQIPEDRKDEFLAHYQRYADRWQSDMLADLIPQEIEKFERQIRLLELSDGLLAQISLDPKKLDFFLRTRIALP